MKNLAIQVSFFLVILLGKINTKRNRVIFPDEELIGPMGYLPKSVWKYSRKKAIESTDVIDIVDEEILRVKNTLKSYCPYQ